MNIFITNLTVNSAKVMLVTTLWLHIYGGDKFDGDRFDGDRYPYVRGGDEYRKTVTNITKLSTTSM